jgi:hypothetical protein
MQKIMTGKATMGILPKEMPADLTSLSVRSPVTGLLCGADVGPGIGTGVPEIRPEVGVPGVDAQSKKVIS